MTTLCKKKSAWYGCELLSTEYVGQVGFKVGMRVYVKCLGDGSTNVVFNGGHHYKMLTKNMCRESLRLVNRLKDDEQDAVEEMYDVACMGL